MVMAEDAYGTLLDTYNGADIYDIVDADNPEVKITDCNIQEISDPLFCWGIEGFVKPPLSNIWIPERFVGKPKAIRCGPYTLDTYVPEPKFSILPDQFLDRIPSSVKSLLAEYASKNSSNKLQPENSSKLQTHTRERRENITTIVEESSSNNTSTQPSESEASCSPSTSTSTSVEHLENVICTEASNDLGTKEIVYEGNPTVYQKSKEQDSQKTTNKKKKKKADKDLKKALKNHVPSQNVVLEERNVYLREAIPFSVSNAKQYSLNFAQVTDPNKAYAKKYHLDTYEQMADPCFISEHCNLSSNTKLAVNSIADFPLLSNLGPECESRDSPNDNTLISSTQSALPYVEDSVEEEKVTNIEEENHVVFIDNIPLNVDETELDCFLKNYGDVQILSRRRCRNKITVELSVGKYASWIVECLDGTEPFGACTEPINCYMKS